MLVSATIELVKYVGNTKRNPSIRIAEHLRSNSLRSTLKFYVEKSGLSREQARVLEQININKYGLNNLYNKINSIAPEYWKLYGIE